MSVHGDALRSLWSDVCTITAKVATTDATTKLTSWSDTTLLSDAPCRISFESLDIASGDPAAYISQKVKLFLSSETVVPAGCEVSVTRGGATMHFKSSGAPALYSDHQEIILEPAERWA